MADEEENHEEIIRLTQQLIEIQKKLKEVKRGTELMRRMTYKNEKDRAGKVD